MIFCRISELLSGRGDMRSTSIIIAACSGLLGFTFASKWAGWLTNPGSKTIGQPWPSLGPAISNTASTFAMVKKIDCSASSFPGHTRLPDSKVSMSLAYRSFGQRKPQDAFHIILLHTESKYKVARLHFWCFSEISFLQTELAAGTSQNEVRRSNILTGLKLSGSE